MKLWIDDIRTPKDPENWIILRTTDSALDLLYNNPKIATLIAIDHDAGSFQFHGGDFIEVPDYLEFIGAENIKFFLLTDNAVGRENMRRIVKYNEDHGWKEIFTLKGED